MTTSSPVSVAIRTVVRSAAAKFDLRVVVIAGVSFGAGLPFEGPPNTRPTLKTQAAGLEPAEDILTTRRRKLIGASPQRP